MQYVSLYRKYRPKSFKEIVGQETIVKILKNSIINNKIGHAYIFSGPRGTGKTSIAKIFSKAVNCIDSFDGDVCEKCEVCKNNIDEMIDIVEIDAASNNGVDEIREIRNNVKLMPSKLKYKVYIIDEVHMLSGSAFNALLKTLEEPPSHVIFILATTEVNKIPATVLSRCQKFDFKRISDDKIISRLREILTKENKCLPNNAVELVAKLSDGGLRDSINLLDQILSLNNENISEDDIYNLIGDVNDEEIFKLLNYIINSNIKELLSCINNYFNAGKNVINIFNKLEILVKNIMIYNSTNQYFDADYETKLCEFSRIDTDLFLELSKQIFDLLFELKRTNNQAIMTEIYLLRMALIFNKKKTQNCEQKNDKLPEESVIITENNDDLKNQINSKKIKINNSLFGAKKEYKMDFISKFDSVKEYVSTKEFNAISNLLLKSKPEVVSDKNIMFTFKNKFEVVLFDKNIEDIQKFIKKLYNKLYVVVAITEDDWKIIKKEYIQNIKSGIEYKYIDEQPITKNNKKNTELQNSLENIFGDQYVSM